MGVDGNFKRLEGEVERLVEVLEQLRQENAALEAQVNKNESRDTEIETLRGKLAQAEEKNAQAAKDREQARSKISAILARLDQIDLTSR